MLTNRYGGFIRAGRAGWLMTFAAPAALMLAVLRFTLAAPKPAPGSAGVGARQEFRHRSGSGTGAMLLALVLLYRLPDDLVTAMAQPFLLPKESAQWWRAHYSQTGASAPRL
jgi:PAT family beta-lactamase induction signal transducer AmpG